MATAARDRLARMLRGDAKSSFSVEVTARAEELSLAVEGLGPVSFPVTPAKARKLIALGRPARFGRGEQTLTDTDVRDTWEIPKHLVRAEWNGAVLKVILATVKEELGLPHGCELTADLHSLLVYEPNQFFVAHQDSEKDDTMVGTLVVTLPSSYAGGELMVEHNEERKAYQGSKTALSLVAFYTDCRHEVLRVKSGYRVTLTYNLLLDGDTSRQEGDAGTVTELTALLSEHFATPASRYWEGPLGDLPNRLVYLLDHEYTPRALDWTRLKGADARRVQLLRTAAEQAGCETVLALADLKTSHSAFPEHPGYWRDWDEDEECDDGSDADDGKYRIHDLIDSEVTLTHWTGPDGKRLEQTSLAVGESEVCAPTETGDLKPYSSEYEGYMGNWGNTLDRWYHRAAVVVWPRDLAFANHAETSPSWALDELALMAVDDAAAARAAAATLAPFWDSALRAQSAVDQDGFAGLFGKAVRTAGAMADEETAALLLRPFRVEKLTAAEADQFGALAARYGQRWTANLLGGWFWGEQRGWPYNGGQDRQEWVTTELPGLCAALHAVGGHGTAAAQMLLDLSWKWLAKAIDAEFATSLPSIRAKRLSVLGRPLASLLTAATRVGSDATSEIVSRHVEQLGDAVVALELAALRAAPGKGRRKKMFSAAAFDALAADCAARLRARLAQPQRAADDWSIPLDGCRCDLCGTLRAFLADPARRTLDWPLATDSRRHIHSRLDAAEVPVTHVTRRQGRPYTLVLTKTDELFTREQAARATDQDDLAWLSAAWHINSTPGHPSR